MKAAERMLRKQRRGNARFRKNWVQRRTWVQNILERHGHLAIRVRQTRSVIDAPYKHARMTEVLLTLRRVDPIILPIEWLEWYCKHGVQKDTDTLYEHMKRKAKAWARERAPVRHTKWKEGA